MSRRSMPLALRLAAWMVGSRNRDYLLGDLMEGWSRDIERRGEVAAGRRLWCEAGRAVMAEGIGRFRNVGARRRLRVATACLAVVTSAWLVTPLLRASGSPRMHAVEWPDSMAGIAAPAASILLRPIQVGAHAQTAAFSLPEATEPFQRRAVLGRGLRPGDETSAIPVAVMTDRTWREEYGASPGIVGALLEVDLQRVRIVGVVDYAFDWPEAPPALWIASPARPDRLRQGDG